MRRSTSAREMPKQKAMAQLSRPFQIALARRVSARGRVAVRPAGALDQHQRLQPPRRPAPPPRRQPRHIARSQRGRRGESGSRADSDLPRLRARRARASRARSPKPTEPSRPPSSRPSSSKPSPRRRPSEAAPAQTASTRGAARAGASAKARGPGHQGRSACVDNRARRTVHKASGAPRAASGVTAPSGQRTVEAELAKGDVVVLLFWNPKGADDVAVHRALQLVLNAHRSARQQIAVQEAQPSRVASFGSITRGVQVYATPTILIVNKHGQTIVLTGLQDASRSNRRSTKRGTRSPTLARVSTTSEELVNHLERPLGRGHTPHGAFTGAAGGAACGDLIRVSIALDPDSPDGRIDDAGFDASGCGATDRGRQRRRGPAARSAPAQRRADRRGGDRAGARRAERGQAPRGRAGGRRAAPRAREAPRASVRSWPRARDGRSSR